MYQDGIFKPVPRPQTRSNFPPNSIVYTWSDEILGFLERLATRKHLPAPKLIHLNHGAAYDYTYSLTPDSFTRAESIRISSFAASLLSFSPGRKRLFFTGLIPDNSPKHLMHVFFAALRQGIERFTGKPFSALYTPLGNTGQYAGEFRLHADLYLPRILFNVFNDVAEDGTGMSSFLEVRKFMDILDMCKRLPRGSRNEIKALFTRSLRADGYERFISLVHDEANPWQADLWNRMQKAQELIAMRRGDGYMINDRLWLHGRTLPTRKVTKFRLHRLVFSPTVE